MRFSGRLVKQVGNADICNCSFLQMQSCRIAEILGSGITEDHNSAFTEICKKEGEGRVLLVYFS
jgi:hypothetical protein